MPLTMLLTLTEELATVSAARPLVGTQVTNISTAMSNAKNFLANCFIFIPPSMLGNMFESVCFYLPNKWLRF